MTGTRLAAALVVGCLTISLAPSPADADASSVLVRPPRLAAPAAHADPRCPPPHPNTIRRAPGAGRTVALTFDDGPGPWTPKILDVLTRFGVRATFFDTGAHDARYPDYARAGAAAGDPIEVHSWDHRYPRQVRGGWTRAYLRDQFARTAALQSRLTGRASCLVRPPGGHEPATLVPTAHSLRLSVAEWSVDPQDWRQPGHASRAAVSRIVSAARSTARHPIVLLHAAKASHESEAAVSSYRGNTVAALPGIIAWYRGHGYRFVTLSPPGDGSDGNHPPDGLVAQ